MDLVNRKWEIVAYFIKREIKIWQEITLKDLWEIESYE